MGERLVAALIEGATSAITAHADELTRLDQAIGDGDHGINMARGAVAIRDQGAMLAALGLPDALQKAGMVVLTTVGGASGPLYASLLLAIGKALKADAAIEAAVRDGVEAVKKRGKSDVGAKTMLDVLVPLADLLETSAGQAPHERLAAVRRQVDEACEATRGMRATRGRASFLGERSVGHLDPGASSARLLIYAVCDALETPH